MKKIFSALLAVALSVAVTAQTVTIQVRGERNGSILVDEQTYGVSQDPSSVKNANLPIVISDLSLGAHTAPNTTGWRWPNHHTITSWIRRISPNCTICSTARPA